MIRITGMAARLGDTCELAALGVSSAERERLARLGLRCFTRCDAPLLATRMRDTAAETLARAAIEPSDVDRVILATSSYAPGRNSDDLPRVARDLGLREAVPLGVSQGFCTNFTLAFEVAAAFIDSGRARNVLLITADRYESDVARVLRSNAGLGSDGAASCLLTREAVAGFGLLSVAHAYGPEAIELRESERLVDYVRVYAAGYQLACRRALDAAATSPDMCAALLVPNFSDSVVRNLRELAGFAAARVYRRDVEHFAHCNSVDQLLALATLFPELEPGARLLMTGAGEHLWGAAVVQHMGDPT